MFGRHSQDFSSALQQHSQLGRRPQLALSQFGTRGASGSTLPRPTQIELGNGYSDAPKVLGPRPAPYPNKAMGLGSPSMADETVLQLHSEIVRLQEAYANLLKELAQAIHETRQDYYQAFAEFKKENDKNLHDLKGTVQKMLDTCPVQGQDVIDPAMTFQSMIGG